MALATLPSRADAGDTSYKVAPGDKINILVMGQPDLSGEIMIDGDQSVTLPLVGNVAVGGMSVDEIGRLIASRLAGGYVKDPVVSVRLTEMRPIYVVGDVKTPGSFPYRNGVSVLAAVALAGGYLVTEEQAQAVLRVDYLAADERVRTLEATRLTLVARRARLEAQRDGRDKIDFGALTAEGGGASDQVAELIKSESGMHDFQMQALQEQIALLEQQEPRYNTEIQFIDEQTAHEKVQLDLIQQHIASLQSLIDSGLTRRFEGVELRREQARNEGNIAALAGARTQIDVDMGEIKLRIRDANDAFQRRVRTELQDTLLNLATTDASLSSARATRELRLRQVGFVEDATGTPRRSLLITRTEGGKTETFPVDDTAPLEPGDILRIERQATPQPTDLPPLPVTPSAAEPATPLAAVTDQRLAGTNNTQPERRSE